MGLTICLESKNDLVVKKDLICQDNKRNKVLENLNNPSPKYLNEINEIINEEDEDNLNIIDNITNENLEKKSIEENTLKSKQNTDRKKENEKENLYLQQNEKKEFYENIIDKISVNNIIPEQKLHSKNNNEIMFIGDLEKIEGCVIFPFFSTLTRQKINFYENKSHFIAMKKPNSFIELKKIKNADLIKGNNNPQLLLCIIMIENNEKKIFQTKTKELLFKWLCVLNYFIYKSQI